MRIGLRILALILALGWSLTVHADDVIAPEPRIEETIGAQIEAFMADDFATAFSFASPVIQGMFGTHQRFGQMVQNGYPMVWRPGDVQYLELRSVDGALWQRVMIRDQTGGVHMLDYQMVQMDGLWRINGVTLVRATGVGA